MWMSNIKGKFIFARSSGSLSIATRSRTLELWKDVTGQPLTLSTFSLPDINVGIRNRLKRTGEKHSRQKESANID